MSHCAVRKRRMKRCWYQRRRNGDPPDIRRQDLQNSAAAFPSLFSIPLPFPFSFPLSPLDFLPQQLYTPLNPSVWSAERLQIVVQTLFPACTIGEPYSLNKGAMLVCVCERWMAVGVEESQLASSQTRTATTESPLLLHRPPHLSLPAQPAAAVAPTRSTRLQSLVPPPQPTPAWTALTAPPPPPKPPQ